ncbi:MAG: sphingosine kinase [Pseudomonadota bacterium]|nr:sphingosine kinase [Pseudomonadota bacterium]
MTEPAPVIVTPLRGGMTEPVPVIVNAAAGTKPRGDEISAAFEAVGASAHILLIREPQDVARLVQAALAGKPRCIAAAGGDGTINAVASQLVGSGVALGVLPLGTLNHFARDAGIPLDLAGAAQNIVAGRIVEVDVGRVNEHYFLNNSSLGLYPRMVRMRERQQHRSGIGKWPALLWAGYMVLKRYAFVHVDMQANGEHINCRTPLVFIGNNPYVIQGLDIGHRTELQTGALAVYITRGLDRWGLFKLAFRALVRTSGSPTGLDMFATRKLSISTRRGRLLVSVDGEVRMMNAPLEYSIEPRSLRVIVPVDALAAPPAH